MLCNLEDDLMRLYKVQQSQPWFKDLNQVNRLGWDGMGMGWNGMGFDGMEWDDRGWQT